MSGERTYYRLPIGNNEYATIEGVVIKDNKDFAIIKTLGFDTYRKVPLCNIIPNHKIDINSGLEKDPKCVNEKNCKPCEVIPAPKGH